MANEFVTRTGLIVSGSTYLPAATQANKGYLLSFDTSTKEVYYMPTSSVTVTVPGSDTQVIYNNGGSFGASSNFVFSGSNVGIGTTSPNAKLDVSGSVLISGSLTISGSSTFTNIGPAVFTGSITQNASTASFGGLVGIGTTTPSNTLQVVGGVTATSFTGSFSGSVSAPGSTTQIAYNSGGALAADSGFVYSGSNVGIGTTSPGEKLTVIGKALLNNGSSLYVDSTATQTVFANIANIPIRFQTNSANRLTIGGAGVIQFNSYDSTNNTGTPTYLLGTDASGNIVKTNTVPGSAAGPYLPLVGGTLSGTVNINASTALMMSLNRTSALGGYLRFQNNSVDKFYIGSRGVVSGGSGTGYDIYAVAENDLRFFAGAALALTLDTSQNATFAGRGIFSDNVQIVYTGSKTNDAGLYIENDSDDWGIHVNKNASNFGIRITSDGGNAFGIYSDANVAKVTFSGTGDATFAGAVTGNAIPAFNVGTIGAIGNTANDVNIYSTTAGHNGLRMHVNGILPTDNTGTIIDNDADLGDSGYRFKDLYLGGSITAGAATFSSSVTATTFLGDLNGTINTATTGTTQAAGDNSTLIATTAYADAAAGAVPIGNYLPLAGGTMTGTSGVLFPDDFKLNIGTGSDLQIYHDGSNSYIDEAGQGSLYNRSTLFIVQNIDSTKNSIIGNPTADVKLYYNGVKKFETTNTGVTVTGGVVASSFTGSFSGSVAAPGSTTQIAYNSGGVLAADSGLVYSGSRVGIGTTSPNQKLTVSGSISINKNAEYLYSKTSTDGNVRMLGINSSDIAYIGPIDAGPTQTHFNASSTSTTSHFYTSGSIQMSIGSTGNVGIGVTSPTYNLEVSGSGYISGSLTVAGTITAQKLNVQQITSSVIYSSGSNIFGNDITNTQTFTGSLQATGSTHYLLGDVGIGTTIPATILHLKDSGTTAITFEDSAGGTQTAKITYDQSGQNNLKISTQYQSSTDDNKIYFAPADSIAMTIRGGTGSSNGFVGIGTTNPTYKLHVDSNTDSLIRVSNGTETYLQSTYFGYSSTYDVIQIGDTYGKGNNGVSVALGIDPSIIAGGAFSGYEIALPDLTEFITANGPSGSATDWNQAVLVLSGSNVGIGTGAPSYKLDVNGTGGFSGDLSVVTAGSTAVLFDGTNPSLTLRRNNNGNASAAINFKGSSAVKWQVGTNQAIGLGFEINEGDATANKFYLAPGGAATFSAGVTATSFTGSFSGSITAPGSTTQVAFNSGGTLSADSGFVYSGSNVGIGTTTPQLKLHISGSTGADSGIRQSRAGVKIWDQQIDSSGRLIWSHYASEGGSANQLFTLDDSNRVGIDNATPQYQLHVGDGSEAEHIMIQSDGGGATLRFYDSVNDSGGDRYQMIGHLDTTQKLQFSATSSGLIAMSIVPDGKVGIGTTNPSTTLQVVGAISASGAGYIQGNLSVGTTYNGFAANIAGTTYVIGASVWVNDDYGYANASSGGTGFFPSSSTAISINSGGNTRMFIASGSGNVGIGTTSPLSLLNVIGGNTAAVEYITIGNQAAYHWGAGYNSAGNTDAFVSNNYNSDSARFDIRMKGTALTDAKVTVLGSGNVGIGTTLPEAKLDVLGTVRAGVNSTFFADNTYLGINYNFGATEATDNVDYKINGGAFTTGGNFRWFTQTGGVTPTESLRITSGGNVLINTTTDSGFKLDVSGTGRFNGNVLVGNVASSGYAFTSFATDWSSGSEIYTAIKIGAAGDNLVGTGVDLRVYSNYATSAATEFRLFVNNNINVLTEALRIASTGAATFSSSGNIVSLVAATSTASYLKFAENGVADRWCIGTNASDASFYFRPTSNTTSPVLTLASTGAATFSSSVIVNNATNDGVGALQVKVLAANQSAARIASTTNNNLFNFISNDTPGHAILDLGKFTESGTYAAGFIRLRTDGDSWIQGGNVGIGTTSPSYKLTINSADENHLRLENGSELGIIRVLDSGPLDIWSHGDTANEIFFRQGTGSGTVKMAIDASGSVGIGTTSPADQLHINNDTSNSYATLRLEGANRGGIINFYNASYPTNQILGDQSGNIYIATSGAFGSTSLSTKVTFATGGNVGIGTTSPSYKLHVSGAIAIEAESTTTKYSTTFSGSLTTNTNIAFVPTGSFKAAFFDYYVASGSVNMRAGTVMAVHNNSTSRYTDTSTGDIGDTAAVDFSTSTVAGSLVLTANISSGTWEVKTAYRAL